MSAQDTLGAAQQQLGATAQAAAIQTEQAKTAQGLMVSDLHLAATRLTDVIWTDEPSVIIKMSDGCVVAAEQ